MRMMSKARGGSRKHKSEKKTYLPASVAGDTRYNQAVTGRTSGAHGAISVIWVTPGASFLRKLHHDAEDA